MVGSWADAMKDFDVELGVAQIIGLNIKAGGVPDHAWFSERTNRL